MTALWPPERQFLVKDWETMARVSIPKGQWLGLYSFGELVCRGTSAASMSKKVKSLPLGWPLFCVRCESRSELLPALVPGQRDHYSQLKYCAYAAVAEARKRGDKAFRRDLANEASRTTKPRGDSATAEENMGMLAVLWRLNRGDTLKQIAIDQAGQEGYEGRMRSLSVRIKRFSRRVCDALTERYGYLPAELLQESPASDAHIAGTFREWPGVHLPDHISSLREALKCGLPRNR